ncbi:RadC family protein [Pseudomonas sp. NPDC077405]
MNEDEKAVVQQALAILDRHMRDKSVTLESPEAARAFLRLQLERRESEVFALVLLDAKHRLIAYRELFFGTIDGASVYPREVVKVALADNAAACFLVHNHPSGQSHPSQADRVLTQRLKDALALIDVRVLDHFVVGQSEITSLAELGWM